MIQRAPAAPYRDVQMYDIDGLNASSADVTALHNAGKKAVCYISVGSYEDWRPDASQFPAAIFGNNLDGWPGERWLDVRNVQQANSALAAIMNARLDMCKNTRASGSPSTSTTRSSSPVDSRTCAQPG